MGDNIRESIIIFTLIICQLILVLNTKDYFRNWMLEQLLIMAFLLNNNLNNLKEILFKCKRLLFEVTICLKKDKFSQMTVQPSIVSTKIKRTKFFFGYRYMWTRCQLSEPCSYVGAGVRKDVASPPNWTKSISDKMV